MDPLSEIKRKLDLVEYINQRVPLTKAGRNFRANCPFHSEKTPSFVVSPDRQIWHCFGSCNEGGDIFKFLMKWENLTFGEALKVLATEAGVELKSEAVPDQQWKERERLYTLNQYAADFYQFLFDKHRLGENARQYVLNRSVNLKTAQHFGLGYAPRSWDSLFKFLSKKGYQTPEMIKAGLIIKTDKGHYYDRFRSRLMFPLTDIRGNILGFSGRQLGPGSKMDAKYLNTPETILYHKREHLFGLTQAQKVIRETNEIILVEGEFDVILAHQYGYKQAVAIKGSALTQEHLRLIKRLTQRITFALDMDEAGQEAIERSITEAEKHDFEMHVLTLSAGKDPAELLAKDHQEFAKAYEQKQTIYEYLMTSFSQRAGLDTIYRKKELVEKMLPYLKRIRNPIVLDHYTARLSELTGINTTTINRARNSFDQQKHPLTTQKNTPPKREKPKMEATLEQYLLALFVQTGQEHYLLQQLTLLQEADYFNPAIYKIFKMAKEHGNSPELLQRLGAILPQELMESFNRAYLTELPAGDIDWEKEIKKTILNIKKHALKRQIRQEMAAVNDDQVKIKLQELKEVEKELAIM